MKKTNDSNRAGLSPRILPALLLCSLGVSLAFVSLNARPLTKFRAAKLTATAPASQTPSGAEATTATSPGMPRYYNYAPPPGIGESSGEPSIGFNPKSGKVMYLSNVQTLQATLPEDITPLGSVPSACNADWLNVSFTATGIRSVDPILFTDQLTGRTFVSQLNTVTQTNPVLIGLNSLMAYTDDDGANWTPAQINPPDGSNDHQTVGAGPYPVALPLGNPVNKGSAVYYCGQAGYVYAITGIAYCSRSDDGGLNFGKSVPIYENAAGTCVQSIHGHVKVAPDGTVYVPNAQCGGGQAVAVSTDAGTTWTVHTVPGSQTGSVDPQVAIASDNTVYFAFSGPKVGEPSSDHHMFVAVSHDHGQTWSTPVDVGASLGIKNAVFPAAVAGDPTRAAVGFLGTTTGGNHQDANFTGTWYGFVAHTYDGGQTWTTVNATPNKPVQRNACIWNGGGANVCRNLLDFTDATIDDKGRMLFAFADGCIDECETGGANSYSAKATIARQSGGKGVFAQFDPVEPALPTRACLSACRDDKASYLQWTAPDNGGSDITAYYIYRNTGGADTFVGQVPGTATSFNDRSVDPAVANYTYKIVAVNALGAGPESNSVTLPVGICLKASDNCATPGVTKVVDPAADETDGQAAHDITSVSMSEPITNPTTGAASNVVFSLKVASFRDAAGNFTVPPGFRWSIRFGVIKNGVVLTAPSSGIPNDTSVSDYFVAVASDGTGPGGGNRFEWGVTSTPNNTARVFTVKGDIDPSSSIAPDGTITLVVPKSIIQNPNPGDSISITLASVRGALPSGTNETIFDSTGAGSYTLRANNLCLANTAPVAVLTADVNQGGSPLTVNFNASGSSDPDSIDTVASYTFNFGDGGDDVTQPTPTITHTFNNPSQYIVRLVVTDSRGKQSGNTAQLIVNVAPPVNVFSRKTHGSAGPFDLALPITGTPGVECRSGGANGDHELVFVFANNLTSVGGASVTSGTATVSSAAIDNADSRLYHVHLTGVANAQRVTVNLSNVLVSGGSNITSLPVTMSVLAGDTTQDGVVNSADIAKTKSQSGQSVTTNNYLTDVTVDGNVNSADIALTKSKSGTGLP